MSGDHGPDDGDVAAEWRRLRRAALFFAVCVAVVVTLAAVGLYH